MMKIEYKAMCGVPGFETVEVTYNLMASGEDMEVFQRTMGQERAEIVVVNVSGLPDGYTGPLDNKLPVAFRVWYAVKGFVQASLEYASDPNS